MLFLLIITTLHLNVSPFKLISYSLAIYSPTKDQFAAVAERASGAGRQFGILPDYGPWCNIGALICYRAK